MIKISTQWDFAYDGDGTRVTTLTTPYDQATGLPQTSSLTSYFFGGAYETRSDGGIFKYYSFGGQSIVNEYKPATQTWTLSYLLTDHLGSVVAVTNSAGALISQQRYLPFGGVRSNVGSILQTDYGYTGQRNLDDDLGLMDYKARFYSPVLNRFIQPDTLTPGGPQGLNRFSYVNNNPINFNDPTGHVICDADGNCNSNNKPKLSPEQYLKKYIKSKYGITMSDDGDKDWTIENLRIAAKSLAQINNALNGKLISFAYGWTFKMMTQSSGYRGVTSTDGTMQVEFYTSGNNIVQQNIFHEVGHLIDSVPGMQDIFSIRDGINNSDFLDKKGYLDPLALIDSQTPDMYQNPQTVFNVDDSTRLLGQAEHWADMFANYVAGNINLDSPEGRAMNTYVQGALCSQIGTKCPP